MASVRFICGTQDLHRRLEKRIAEFLRMDDSILFAACFDANGGVFEPLLGPEDAVISDALNHASIIDGIRLCKAQRHRYPNSDMQALEEALQAYTLGGAYANFLDAARARPVRHQAYHAAFSYPGEVQAARVTQPVLILNTHGSLAEQTRALAPHFSHATLVEIPELHHGVFDVGAAVLSDKARIVRIEARRSVLRRTAEARAKAEGRTVDEVMAELRGEAPKAAPAPAAAAAANGHDGGQYHRPPPAGRRVRNATGTVSAIYRRATAGTRARMGEGPFPAGYRGSHAASGQ